MSASREVFICGAARTPFGKLGGSLAALPAPALGAAAIREALRRARVAPGEVQELFMGNVLSGNVGQAPARQAALAAGVPQSCVCTTVNKVCASGAKAVILAAQSIMLGTADVVVAGGMESMSNAPYYLPRVRQGLRMGHSDVVDAVIKDGLWDPYGNVHMGMCAELCSRCAAARRASRRVQSSNILMHTRCHDSPLRREHDIGRAAQDAHAARSHARAAAAVAAGAFADEVVPVEVPAAKKGSPPTRVTADESVAKGGDAASLAKCVRLCARTLSLRTLSPERTHARAPTGCRPRSSVKVAP